MHRDIEKTLTKIGLTDTEQQLYLSGLEVGVCTPAALAKTTGIKRTTAYSALDSLVEKGMAASQKRGQTTVYTMQPPAHIEHKLSEQVAALQEQQLDFADVLPLFDSLIKKGDVTTSVAEYVGEQGVHTAVDMALFCRSRKWKIIAGSDNFFSQGGKQYADYFIKTRKQRGITAKSLWEPSFVSGRKFSPSTISSRDPRVLPKSMAGKIASTMILCDEKVIFINDKKELTAVVIESKAIHDLLELFFDGLWSGAKPVPKQRIKA